MRITAIDMFAGLGGFTESAEQAGVNVVWAANHWPAAVACHKRNHPRVAHCCQDLQQANWEIVPRTHIVLASPACQGHSRARGADRPHHDACRSTAWAVVSCLESHHQMAFVVENVPEFVKWPLFPAWRQAIETLDYQISVNVLDAADFGTPQHRLRVFIVGMRSEPPMSLALPQAPHLVPASSFIDFNAGGWSRVHKPGRAAATLERYHDGRKRFGERFAFSYYGNSHAARCLDRPIGTITTRDRWAVVDGRHMRMLTASECQAAMGFRSDYRIPEDHGEAVFMLGNAVPPPMGSAVVRQVAAEVSRRIHSSP